jgi:hypothetical protein
MRVRNPKALSLYQMNFVAQDIQVEMAEVQHWQNARFDFEGFYFHSLSLFIFLALYL